MIVFRPKAAFVFSHPAHIIAFGFGAASSMAEAARHAVGELAQCESNLALIEETVGAVGVQRLTPEARALLQWWRTARLSGHRHLAGHRKLCSGLKRAQPLSLDLAHSMCRRRGLR